MEFLALKSAILSNLTPISVAHIDNVKNLSLWKELPNFCKARQSMLLRPNLQHSLSFRCLLLLLTGMNKLKISTEMKKIENAIIYNGRTFALVEGNPETLCYYCDLNGECNASDTYLCHTLWPHKRDYHFRELKSSSQ